MINETSEVFDLKLSIECANAFSVASGLGCTVARASGEILYEAGYGLGSCRICSLSGGSASCCTESQIYGMVSADRFGGKYIYFCPRGLTCFTSPIEGAFQSEANITVGPFLMVDSDDYAEFELKEMLHLPQADIDSIKAHIQDIPFVEPARVNALSTLLFMALGFINNVAYANRMLTAQDTAAIQGRITAYIQEIKMAEELTAYPLNTERALLHSIENADKPEASKLLNQLLGHIFFATGRDFERIRAQVYELLILMSRAAINGGADTEYTFMQNHMYLHEIQQIKDIDALCFWLKEVMDKLIENVFAYRDVKHTDIIRKAHSYMRLHYTRKVTLEEVAQQVYLSPTYFSKIFKQEMGMSFSMYLNHLRVEKSKTLLRNEGLNLLQIAMLSGFEDQSYFSKVFRKTVGVSPSRFRESFSKYDNLN